MIQEIMPCANKVFFGSSLLPQLIRECPNSTDRSNAGRYLEKVSRISNAASERWAASIALMQITSRRILIVSEMRLDDQVRHRNPFKAQPTLSLLRPARLD